MIVLRILGAATNRFRFLLSIQSATQVNLMTYQPVALFLYEQLRVIRNSKL